MRARRTRVFSRGMNCLFLAFVFLAAVLNAASWEEKYARVDDIFAEWNKPDSPGCALALVKDGKVIYKKGYGMANLEHEIPIRTDTVFRTGSIGKQFTAACILILQQRGKLSLDADIRTYLPEMPEYEWPVTIRHLIHHTSGIREYETLQALGGELTDQGHHTNEDILELLTRQKGLDFRPGETHQYCNSGYTLLAVIIERVSGKTIGEFAKENIFDPLGMTKTFILEDNRVVVKNRAKGYGKIDGHFKVFETLNESTGDGAVFTTVEDYFLWDQNFYQNKLECDDFAKNMLTVGRLNDGSDAIMSYGGYTFQYAFGLVRMNYRGLNAFGHGGSYVGFRAHFLQFPEQKTSIILMFNLANVNPTDISHKIADVILEAHFTKPKGEPSAQESQKTEAAVQTPSIKNVDEYTGDYYSDEVPVTWKLRIQNGKLYFVQHNAPSEKPLLPQEKEVFSYWAIQIKFTRAPQGEVDGFMIVSSHLKGLVFKKLRGSSYK
ncbi:MAG: beta-lactamase family protein [Candidatus Aminicenantes bacterium]|nr:beta-lactamase family protein [Candidatus Aminicenantes bacterium]